MFIKPSRTHPSHHLNALLLLLLLLLLFLLHHHRYHHHHDHHHPQIRPRQSLRASHRRRLQQRSSQQSRSVLGSMSMCMFKCCACLNPAPGHTARDIAEFNGRNKFQVSALTPNVIACKLRSRWKKPTSTPWFNCSDPPASCSCLPPDKAAKMGAF